MKTERKLTLTLLSSLVFTGVLSIGLCVGWFHKNNAIDVDQLTGSVLKKYFEDGDGSEAHPFEIARPKQYENFVRLHYEMEGFADRKFYFELGHVWKNADGSYKYSDADGNPITTPVFADYNDDGVLTSSSYSLSLNMNSMKSFPPIGSDQLPFNAKLEGNGLTVTKFKVVGTGYSDIGVFGYVGAEGTVSNVYFSDFSIDTTTGAYPQVLEGNPSRNHDHDDENVFMGYIAGHIQDAQAFTNVYVNRCTLKGDSQNAKTINNYGYYGQAEVDGLGGMTGVGNDYQFELNAGAFYSYFSGAYDTIKENRLLLRNTQETGKAVYDADGNLTGGYQDMYPKKISDAISPTTFSLGGVIDITSNAYQLNGNTPSAPNSYERNYSISTTGYRGYPIDYVNHYYDVVYKDSGGTNRVAPSDTVVTTQSLNEMVSGHDRSNPLEGDFYSFDTDAGKWVFLHASARQTEETDKRTNNKVQFEPITFSLGTNTSSSCSVTVNSAWLSIDDNAAIDVKSYVRPSTSIKSTTLWIWRAWECSVSFNPINVGVLVCGSHNISLKVDLSFSQFDNRRLYYGSLSQKTVDNGSSSEQVTVLTEKPTLFIKNYGTDTSNFTIDINVGDDYSLDDGIPFVFETSLYLNTDHYESPLYAAETTYANGRYVQVQTSANHSISLTDSKLSFERQGDFWFTHAVLYEEDTGKAPVDQYIGDSDQLVKSGYNSRNIDIVGGDVKFTTLNLNSTINLISIPSESSGSTSTVNKITESNIGQQFYAPSMCPNSIVLYLKNTSNARDTRDDKLGSIEFTYATMEAMSSAIVNLFGVNIANPVFKKGSKDTVPISDYGTRTKGTLTYTYTCDSLLESDVKEISYCALDKDGKILGNFSSSGDASVGFNSNNNSELLSKIDTYVICIGCYSTKSSSTECWVTDVKFNYQAEAGYGGTFGSVGYRDASDTIDTTILTYYLVFDAGNNQYSILVYFDKNTMAYHIIASASAEVELRVYNYYPDQYSLYISSTGNQDDEVQYSGSVARVSLGT